MSFIARTDDDLYWSPCKTLGHTLTHFNIYCGNENKVNYVACEDCRIFHCLGNIFSEWRDENEEIWRKNRERLLNYLDLDAESLTANEQVRAKQLKNRLIEWHKNYNLYAARPN